MTYPLLQNKRITLRAMEPEDLELMYTIENDVELWEVGCSNTPYSRYALMQFIANNNNDIFIDHQIRLVITLKEDKRPIGLIDLMNFDPLHARAEVGIVVLREFQQCGLATEALETLCNYAHKHLHLHQLYAYVASTNTHSITLFSKIGFSKNAVLTDWLKKENKYVNAVLFQYIF